MLTNVSQFFHPRTIEEACQLLAAKDRRNVALAGGTHLGVIEDPSIQGLVDLKGLKLAYIKRESNTLHLGAMNVIEDLKTSTLLTGASGALVKEVAARIGSTPLRHAITLGGNLVAAFTWSDLPPAMMVLDAQVVLRRGREERILSIETLYETRPTAVLKQDELLVEVRVPECAVGTGTAFTKVARTRNDFATITVAARLTLKGEEITEARVALNAISRRPLRCKDVESFLVGKKADVALFTEAGKKATAGLDFTQDFRASKEYREEVLPIYVRRTLEAALKMAR